MSSLRELLSKNVLSDAEYLQRKRESLSRFHSYLKAGDNDIFLRALYRFVHQAPLRYWDPEIVTKALELLEASADRTASAMAVRSRQMGIGFENLFRQSPASNYEEGINLSKTRDLLRIATEFHPEYLRCTEHIFSNLLIVYWSVLRKGDVGAKYDLRGAVNHITQKGHDFLLNGYNDDIRNAVAHGEVVFRGMESIRYGAEVAGINLGSFQFLSIFDSLRRTSNNLALALLLFIARNKDVLSSTKNFTLPPSVMAFLAAAAIERTGLEVLGVVESEIHDLGKQLHLSVRTFSLYRPMVLLECAQLSMYLLENGGGGYARYLFDIDQGKSITSLAIVKPDRLAELLRENAPLERLGEIFDDALLLWYNESNFRTTVKAWGFIFRTNFKAAKEEVLNNWRDLGIVSRGRGRYIIRSIKNASAGRIQRVHVIAVMRYPEDVNDTGLVREIIGSIIKDISKVWVDPKKVGFEGQRGWVGHPKYIWLRLCRLDGTVRWLEAAGWNSSNLVAMAERVYGLLRKPLQIHNPEETWRGIRIRYSMDTELLKRLSGDSDDDSS